MSLQSGGNYTCVVVDRRDPKLWTSVSVDVHLAENSDETCKKSQLHEVMWPQTYRVGSLLLKYVQLALYGTVAQSIEPLSKFSVWFNSLWVRIMQVVGKNPLLGGGRVFKVCKSV